ncbi:MLP-like protein 34 [Momordica charantia]|uniref:MLP-like protein 34 n=1 Tax=Momordica charantia TaxID=3673 RepID=A0A6J1DQ34_MOMCH|nr:MLP-like protein 34 [Momordica charantia]
MSLFGVLKAEVEIKAAASAFYAICYSKMDQLPEISPDKVKIAGLLDGKTEAAKFEVEAVDEATYSITYRMVEGNHLSYYKTFKILIHAIPKGEGSVVHWGLEYEKFDENIAEPYTFLEYFVNLTKDVDASLGK